MKLQNKRVVRNGFYRWTRPQGKLPALTPADGGSTGGNRFPPYTIPSDHDIVEDWHQEGTAWRPGDLQILPAELTSLTEWQVTGDGTAFIAAVGLPEIAQYAGFPGAIFVSVSLSHPSNTNGIDPTKPWALQISVQDMLEDAVISPISSYLGQNGVYFAAYVRGIVKSLELPVLRLALDVYWNTGYTTYSGELLSNVTFNAPFISTIPPAGLTEKRGASDVKCSRCQKRDTDGWVVLSHPVTPLP